MKKDITEMIGTFVLTIFGSGAAAMTGGISGYLDVLGIAMTFGLSIVAMAYSIGNISGCHINPAVSLGCLLGGRMGVKDFVFYVIFQFIGATIAAALLYWIVNSCQNVTPEYLAGMKGLGTNGYGTLSKVGLDLAGAITIEVVLTAVFVLTSLGVTSKAENGAVAGLVIGLTLAFVHILGICLTGTSVNPARSFGPAVFVGGLPLEQLWVFIVGPFAGAAIAAGSCRFLSCEKCCCKKEQAEVTDVYNKLSTLAWSRLRLTAFFF